jgi:hypothetical protein
MKYLRTARPVFVTARFQGREYTGLEFSVIDEAGIIRRLLWVPGEFKDLLLEDLGARRSRWVSCCDVLIDSAKREKLLALLEKREKRAMQA